MTAVPKPLAAAPIVITKEHAAKLSGLSGVGIGFLKR